MSLVATGGRGARSASIKEKALQRGKINSKQPYLSKHQEQRRVGACAMGAAQVGEGLDHEGPEHESEAGQAHGQRGVEIAVMRVRRLTDP
jgi:hypothetical protein